ncbi:MAG: 2-C-methyl-D-erythritol 4-phosphate cytidylyltransferase, partial [Verrucomicrobia bacterium]|nr:2-C-methyl-D-erythritol 4-phosphate cytidylyltransferase [Verrucomicrobiota bacterium]
SGIDTWYSDRISSNSASVASWCVSNDENCAVRKSASLRAVSISCATFIARDLITKAYAKVQSRGLHVTDDAQAVEQLSHPIALLENTFPNPKLTTPADLPYLEFLLSREPVASAK